MPPTPQPLPRFASAPTKNSVSSAILSCALVLSPPHSLPPALISASKKIFYKVSEKSGITGGTAVLLRFLVSQNFPACIRRQDSKACCCRAAGLLVSTWRREWLESGMSHKNLTSEYSGSSINFCMFWMVT